MKENLMPITEEPKVLERPAEDRPNNQVNRPPEHPHHIAPGKIILVSLLLAARNLCCWISPFARIIALYQNCTVVALTPPLPYTIFARMITVRVLPMS